MKDYATLFAALSVLGGIFFMVFPIILLVLGIVFASVIVYKREEINAQINAYFGAKKLLASVTEVMEEKKV